MSLDWQVAAQRRTRRLIAALVALVVLLVVIVLVLVIRPRSTGPATGDSSPSAAPATSPHQTADASPMATFTPDSSFVAPTRWVRLPRPKGTKLGLPVGYEHTPQGAAAAAVSVTQYGTTWDIDAADRVVQVYTNPAELEAVRTVARTGTMDYREEFGLPRSGPLPAGASLFCAPIGVSWVAIDANTMQVSVLTRTTYATPTRGSQTILNSGQLRMIWVDGDWHNTPYNSSDSSPVLKAADLGSAAFNNAGWTAIQQGSAG